MKGKLNKSDTMTKKEKLLVKKLFVSFYRKLSGIDIAQDNGQFYLAEAMLGNSKTFHILKNTTGSYAHVYKRFMQYFYNVNGDSGQLTIFGKDIVPEATTIFTRYDSVTNEALDVILNQNHIQKKLVIIDCDPSTYKNLEKFKELIFNGRFHNVTLVMFSDNSLCFPPAIRANIDVIMTDLISTNILRKRFWQTYGSYVPDYETFSKLHVKYTKDKLDMMVISNSYSDKEKVTHYTF